ncbi:VOC family protein [Dendronalium sp. ChiSLP03b]|uniref:VOC family protein n=1 Tax=Dendronalium sp. ChiSLP03b TaxID=3075381 RepID=UPI002AD2011B|nr:VOC family protein [Dendronalium sp. ChiSLP03b]MDZ8206584.1 VOC family protein [Dendronalium sp. ChiSLP03b]
MQTTSLQMSTNDFFLEVDRIFICTAKGAESVSVLEELGFYCSNQLVQHVEQGTASRIIFFENTYLELIWVENRHLVKQQSVHVGVHILNRFHGQHIGVSPFGIGLRKKSDDSSLVFRSTSNWTELIPEQMSISFATENLENQKEPFCFVIPDCIALTTWLDPSLTAHQQLISHPLGVKKLTNVKITVNSDKDLTDAMSVLCTHSAVTIERGKSPLLELTFDEGIRDKNLDARPILPILLKY